MNSSLKPASIPRGLEVRLDPVPRVVIFDLDDTLCDHSFSVHSKVRYSFEPYIPAELLDEAVSMALARSRWGSEHFADVFMELGVTDEEAIADARARYVSDRFRNLMLYDDALTSVEMIKEVANIGMITNGPTDIQQPKIDLLKIEHLFPFILISGSVGIWKPDPAIFEMALEKAGASPEEAIYVGDSPIADVPGAHSVGMRPVWMNRAGIEWPGEEPPHLEVRTMTELVIAMGIQP
jgi:HAD superfamily hydrolase (TIGR01549 family)